MSNRSSQIVILCEDTQQESFIRRFLKKAHGIPSALLRVSKNPSGKGSGEQFVRSRYPNELKALRQRQHHANTTLIVAIDADTSDTAQIRKTLNKACSDAGIEPVIDKDNVALVIPKRNIETWITWLNGQQVDETTAYLKLPNESACQPAVEKLYDLCTQSAPPPGFPDSLTKACIEYRKVKTGFST
jgi:hypothetical protein